jgi:RNA polymerase sigma-70 factor (ECF subfamily)
MTNTHIDLALGSSDDAATPVAPEESRAATRTPVIDFRTLFELEGDYVARSLRRLGVRASDIEDATHEVFVAVHARLAEYDAGRPVRPWLFAFAYRVACAEKRRPHHRFDLCDAVPDVVDEQRDAHALVEQNERHALLLAALDALSSDQRAVVVMHEIDGTAIPEVAVALEIPVNTAYSRLRLGREELSRAVRRLKERARS